MNADIPEYSAGNRNNHKPTRPRKILMHRRELNRLMAAVQRDGMTLVPLKLYFNDTGRVKLLLGLARGAKKPTSAKLTKSATGNATRPVCCANAVEFQIKSLRTASKTASNISTVRRPVFVL